MMTWMLSLPEPVRLGLAYVFVLLLPAAFLALCAPVVRRNPPPPSGVRGRLLNGTIVGLPLCLVVWLALRISPAVLAGCLIAAAVFLLIPVVLNSFVSRRTGQKLPALPLSVRLAVALIVPLFFLCADVVASLLRVHFPHIFAPL
ncbi:MAG: hypothetical protein ACRYFS_21815 [Janthinobacterium lividum]